jgi:hypothetical protein
MGTDLAPNAAPISDEAANPCCFYRPHPGARGLSALGLLRLPRLLRPRYAFATIAIASSR